jgi:hypothetical protein
MKSIVQSLLIKCKIEDVVSGAVYVELLKHFEVDESILEEVEELYHDSKEEYGESPVLICIDLGEDEFGEQNCLKLAIEQE